jgi:hypothetical protein
MQKREGMHRRGGELGVALGPIALMFVLWLAAGASAEAGDPAATPAAGEESDAPECPARLLAGSPRGVASGCFSFGNGARGKRRAGFHATAANPYMLEGLVSSDLLFGVDGGSFSAWLDWRHLGHSLYREDRLAAAIGFSCPFDDGFRLYAIPAVERRAARGFGAQGSRSLSLAFSHDFFGSLCIGCEYLAYEDDDPRPRDARAFLLFSAGSLVIAVDRAISGARGADAQCALEAWLSDRCAIVSQYRWKTGEISSGLVVRISRATLDFSWSRNPALGGTVTAGAGRLWEW